MSWQPILTHGDRAFRREKIANAYRRGEHAKALAARFGVTHSYVCQIARAFGCSRPAHRPRKNG